MRIDAACPYLIKSLEPPGVKHRPVGQPPPPPDSRVLRVPTARRILGQRERFGGRSSIGRALALQARGCRFDPGRLHFTQLWLNPPVADTRLFGGAAVTQGLKRVTGYVFPPWEATRCTVLLRGPLSFPVYGSRKRRMSRSTDTGWLRSTRPLQQRVNSPDQAHGFRPCSDWRRLGVLVRAR